VLSGSEIIEEMGEITLSKLQLCIIRNETEKEDNLKIQIISRDRSLTPKSPKDRFMP